MKRKFFNITGVLVVLLALGLVLVGCDSDSDDGGGGGGGTFDPAKLEGTWQKLDVDELFTIKFGALQNIGNSSNPSYAINFDKIGMPGIKGNILGYGDNTCELAFEGEKLVISKSKGTYAAAKLDGTYTKKK